MTIPGAILQGRYQINEQLRQGGMGTVFKANDLRLNRIVAVKESKFTDPKLRKQFELEAQLLAFLRHPSLPIVGDQFCLDDELFLVMDYIDGDDLGEILMARSEPFPPEDVIRWADQLLDALIYIHGQTPPIIHRDIKPQNLKLSSKGQMMLLDFGLAKGFPAAEIRVTTSGSIFGYTPNYAPLEQRQGTGTDARSDLYSLGATLYHLLSAQIPPDASTRAAAVINGDPDPLPLMHAENAKIPRALAEVIHQAMSLKREARPANALEMRRLLTEATRLSRDTTWSDFPEPVPEPGELAPTVDESTVVIPPPVFQFGKVNKPLSSPAAKKIPAKLDHSFYCGLLMGMGSAIVLIASTVLELGIFGVAIWLLSLFLIGPLVTILYIIRSSVPVKPSDAFGIGALAGLTSAVAQWLLLVVAYVFGATYFANNLAGKFGSDDALILFACLLGLLGGFSPIGAFVTARVLGLRGNGK